MSSGFVSGGTDEKPTERDEEWLKAQQEIEANRRRKEEDGFQQGGKSLYEVLQNNKATKQEAFEESIRLKNQFRNLDEDEVEFLDSVLESTRKKEAEVQKETAVQLDSFRRQQEEADRALLDEDGNNTRDRKDSKSEETSKDEKWAVNNRGKKRRERERDGDRDGVRGLKLRRTSSSAVVDSATESRPQKALSSEQTTKDGHTSPKLSSPLQATSPTTSATTVPDKHKGALGGLGLVSYSSDEDD